MTLNLLIIDDEKEIVQALSRHFRFNDYNVLTAYNISEAKEQLSNTPVHIVISDIKMPGGDGTELLAWIRDNSPMTRVIMITGYVTLDNALKCMRYGADDCFFKPLGDFSELDQSVERMSQWHNRWQAVLKSLIHLKPGVQNDE